RGVSGPGPNHAGAFNLDQPAPEVPVTLAGANTPNASPTPPTGFRQQSAGSGSGGYKPETVPGSGSVPGGGFPFATVPGAEVSGERAYIAGYDTYRDADPQRVERVHGVEVERVMPPVAARVGPQAATFIPQIQQPAVQQLAQGHGAAQGGSVAPSNPEHRLTQLPRRHSAKTKPPPTGGRTALGYSSGSGAQSAIVRLGLAPHVSAHLGRLAERVVPSDFHINNQERNVLNVLGETDHVTARQIGQLVGLEDSVTFMEELLKKLETYGLGDLVEPAEAVGGEPSYRMKR
ncbi:MAG TPA: hypothetical protein VGC41_16920, partial [Kofleriaceae bacterium]